VVRKSGARVILMTTNPIRWTSLLRDLYGRAPYDSESEEGLDSLNLAGYNEALRELAQELEVPLVDVRASYPAFAAQKGTTVDGLLLDGMHPNDLGHELVAEMLVPVIRNVVR